MKHQVSDGFSLLLTIRNDNSNLEDDLPTLAVAVTNKGAPTLHLIDAHTHNEQCDTMTHAIACAEQTDENNNEPPCIQGFIGEQSLDHYMPNRDTDRWTTTIII